MIPNLKELYGVKLAASDGDIGHIKDFYFDDLTWVIRYLVADTGPWLRERLVLLTPHALGNYDPYGKTLHVNLRKKQIEASPGIESHLPVSRQYEQEYYHYYGWPAYWTGGALWGASSYPLISPPAERESDTPFECEHRDDKHLQSTRAVEGYEMESPDGAIGHVTGFKLDEKTWRVLGLIVKSGHWYAGREIFIPSAKIHRVSYKESAISVLLTKAEIEQATNNHLATAGRWESRSTAIFNP